MSAIPLWIMGSFRQHNPNSSRREGSRIAQGKPCAALGTHSTPDAPPRRARCELRPRTRPVFVRSLFPNRPLLTRLYECLRFTLIALPLAATAAAQTPLRIAAAADLEPVLPPILAQFQHSTGIHAEATYQASAMLTTQIQNGAPFDLFLSADLSYPKRLIDAGLADAAGTADSSTPIVYARGTLVLWTRKDSHLTPSLDLLRSPDLKRLAVANPDRAPYGRAAVAALTSLKLYDTLKPKLVTAENISQTAQFVDSGNADAGLISLTSAMTPRLSASGTYFIIPRNLYPPIEQGAAIVSKTTQRPQAHKFLDYLLSAPIQSQLAKSGLTPVY
jgi:molybdate transport system substrate-binding protein